MHSTADTLTRAGIQPSAQRLAIAQYVLHTSDHPSADRVWNEAQQRLPMISRATVYNTLNLFVERGLLRQLVLEEGRVVFDPRTEPHHHLIDDDTGRIHDIPWDALEVRNIDQLTEFEIQEYQVVIRGRRRDHPPHPNAPVRES